MAVTALPPLNSEEPNLKRLDKEKSEKEILLSKLYIEKTKGEVTRETFSNLSSIYNRDIKNIHSERLQIQREINKLEEMLDNVNIFLKIVDKINDLCYNDLTEKFVHSIVEKVVIHEREEKYSRTPPNVDVHFIGVGLIDFLENV